MVGKGFDLEGPELSPEEVRARLAGWDEAERARLRASRSPETQAAAVIQSREAAWERFRAEIIKIERQLGKETVTINDEVEITVKLPRYMVAAIMNGHVSIREVIRAELNRQGRTWWRPYWGAKLAAERICLPQDEA